MIKATTSHGTYYIIDEESRRAKRVRAEGRGNMYGDGEWFDYEYLTTWQNRESGESKVEVGKAILFILNSHSAYDWRTTTKVVSVEEYTMDKCYLVTRDKMYDVIIDGKKVGSGQRGYINTAYWFYKTEGFDMEIVYE